MLGHSIAFASFHIVEVMSSPDFASKRIGYLAAAQSFSPTTDVLLLTTNQFKKDLTNGKLQDCSQALTCLGKLVTEDLGRDLEKDVSLLLNSPRPYIRKKALLVLYRLIMVHPDTLPVVSARFRERLTDSDPSVVCAAVTVTCELARTSPKSFLSLAPVLYQLLMNKDSNNWMLIKIVKLMGVLTPLEPRLGKKLVEPITALMRSTRAKSLLYECCSTVTSGLMAHPEAVELCMQRLGEFMDDSDQNLKYLGLLCMKKLIKAHPQLAMEHRDNILDCLDDEDIGIRMRALELVSEFMTKRTLRDISRILLRKLRKASDDSFTGAEGIGAATDGNEDEYNTSSYSNGIDQEEPYRESLARELLKVGEFKRASGSSKGGYELLSTGDDFAWYATSILGGLAEIPMLSTEVRNVIGEQFLELTSRVEALRPISVKLSHSLLSMRVSTTTRETESPNDKEEQTEEGGETEEAEEVAENHKENKEYILEDAAPEHVAPEHAALEDAAPEDAAATEKQPTGREKAMLDPVLSASLAGSTAWILGEYCELIEDHRSATNILVSFPKKTLDAGSQTRILTAVVKIYAGCPDEEAEDIRDMIVNYANGLADSQYAEVQERSWFFKSLLEDLKSGERKDLLPLFDGKLIPVDRRAQSRVPISEELDLDTSLLNTGGESLYSFLLKTIGAVEEEEEQLEDDGDLFREAVFSSNTLSVSVGDRIISSGDKGSLLASLPSVGNKADNPFYLSGTSAVKRNAPSREIVAIDGDQDIQPRYKYEVGELSSEAAVVIGEEPLSAGVNEEEKRPSAVKSASQKRLQAAFDGAFDAPQVAHGATKGSKRKKKKSGRGKKERLASKKAAVLDTAATNLIDIDCAPLERNGEPATSESPKPKHLADVLLM